MPARSVVIEKLTKFTGERHEFLTPGEYTQLTGRAGRRGIDDVGYAVVLWSPFVPFDQVAGLAGARTYALTSRLPPDLQHGRQPGAPVPARPGPPPAQPVVRPVPGRQRRRRARGPAGARREQLDRQRRPGPQRAGATSRSTGAARRPLDEARRGTAATTRVTAALDRLRPGDVLSVPAPGRPGGGARATSAAGAAAPAAARGHGRAGPRPPRRRRLPCRARRHRPGRPPGALRAAEPRPISRPRSRGGSDAGARSMSNEPNLHRRETRWHTQ